MITDTTTDIVAFEEDRRSESFEADTEALHLERSVELNRWLALRGGNVNRVTTWIGPPLSGLFNDMQEIVEVLP